MTSPAISVMLTPSKRLPEYARRAEQLGYERLWLTDSPALYSDVWIAMARAAEATERIGLATGVAVPSLRHVMVTASSIIAVEELAPGRVAAAFGTGFSARQAMGQKPMRWADLERYVVQLRALLRGETVEVDGAMCQFIASPELAPPRPIEVPLLLSVEGPKGIDVARRVADGVILMREPDEPLPDEPRWTVRAVPAMGTVLRPGEDHASARVRDAAGPGAVVVYHRVWEIAPAALGKMPGGKEWAAAIDAERPEGERHLAVHEGHITTVTDRDQPLLDAMGPRLTTGWTADPAGIREQITRATARSALNEVVYSPAGADVIGEMEAFADAAMQ